MSDGIRMVKVRPVGDFNGWLLLKESEFFDSVRNMEPETTRWLIEFAGTMSQAQIDATPEFDGW